MMAQRLAANAGMDCIHQMSCFMGEKLQISSARSLRVAPRKSSSGRMVVAMQSAVIDSHFVLGLDQSASKQEIKRAYRNLALQYHPDVCKGHDKEHLFTQINLAYECLMKDVRAQTSDAPISRDYPGFSGQSDNSSPHDFQQPEWLSEGYTFEEIFGPCYEPVEDSIFQDVSSSNSSRKVKKSCMREDW